jgi:hypothetical protein
MTQHPGYGEQPPPGPPAYPPPPPPRKPWGAGRIVLVTSAGLVLVVGLLVAAVVVLGQYAGQTHQDAERDDQGRIVARATVSKNALRQGDCVNDAPLRDLELGGGDLQTQGDTVEAVPCGHRHDFEVTASFTVPDRDYSEDGALRREVHQGCVRRLRHDWAQDRRLLRDKVLAYYLPATWATQEDHAVCMLQLASAEQMRGSIR